MSASRPRYETEGNTSDERRVASLLGAAWACEIVKLPTAYNLDFAALRDRRVCSWLEIKRRKITLHQFPTVYLSMHKVFAAHNFHAVTGLPCLFVVQFNDCLAYADMLPKRQIDFRGRADRGDWQDQEPVALISVGDFKIITEQRAAA
jgi:hypothetical protein